MLGSFFQLDLHPFSPDRSSCDHVYDAKASLWKEIKDIDRKEILTTFLEPPSGVDFLVKPDRIQEGCNAPSFHVLRTKLTSLSQKQIVS